MDTRLHPKLSLEYILRLPSTQPPVPPPAVVLLHGYRCNERDLYSLGEAFPEELLIFFVRAPQMLHDGQYSWFSVNYSSGKPVGNMEEAEGARIAVIKFIGEISENFHIDTSRIFLGGFSQGAVLSFSVLLTTKSLVKGILPLSGKITPDARAHALLGEADTSASVFLAHGTEDRVIPIRFAHDAKELLKQLNIATEYHEYPIAHSISDAEIADMATWLAGQL